MTVKELIERLGCLPADSEIQVLNEFGLLDAPDISFTAGENNAVFLWLDGEWV